MNKRKAYTSEPNEKNQIQIKIKACWLMKKQIILIIIISKPSIKLKNI